jgi:hypothetical protein
MLTGAGYGGLLVAAVTVVVMVAMGAGALAFWIGLLSVAFATPIWFVGILVVGGPVWWILHRLGLRSRVVCSAAGATLVLLVVGGSFALNGAAPQGDEWFGVLLIIAPLAAIGAIVGWTVARSAYRTERPAND